MNIGIKFTILFLLLSLLPALLVSFLVYNNAKSYLREESEHRLLNVAARTQDKIETLMTKRSNNFAFLTNRIQLITLVAELGEKDSSKKREELVELLTEASQEQPEFQDVFVMNTQGAVIASADLDEYGKGWGNTRLFREGQSENVYLLQYDPVKGVELFLAGPIYLEDKLVGVAAVSTSGNEIMAMVSDYPVELGKTGEFILVGENEQDEEVIINPLRFDQNTPLERALLPNDKMISHASETKHFDYIETVDYRGESVYEAIRHIDALHAHLFAKIDVKEALAPTTQIRQLILITSIIIGFFAIVFSGIFAQITTKPIAVLIGVVGKMKGGDLTQRVVVKSRDEIGKLGEAFNGMVAELQVLYQQMQQKIDEKTKQLQEKIQVIEEENAKDEALLGSIGDGVIALDAQGAVMFMNNQAESLLGIDSKNLVGKPYAGLWQDLDERGELIPDDQRPIQKVMKTSQMFSSSQFTYANNDRKVPVAITVSPVKVQDRLIGVIDVFRDVTHERDVDRMKTEFISLASHQLRTPLSAIKWFGEMLLAGDAGKLNDEQTEFANNISQSTQRMIDLVNGLLNISRIESGRIIIDPQPTDLVALIQTVLGEVKLKIEEKHHNLVVSTHEGLPKINIDPKLIHHVIMNLLTNAIKYTPKGGEIHIFVSKKDENIIVQVTDNGFGIPRSQHKKVFQKFFRAENVVKVETDGTGLGLYLASAIVESSGGKIWFDSDEGKGTTFWVSLPVAGSQAKKGEVSIEA